jgi:hypothetical protein
LYFGLKKNGIIKNKNDIRQLSRFQLLHEWKNTFGDAFGLKEVW